MIRYEGLSKSYGRIVAIDSLTLAVGRGEIFALLGPNGSGKTTSLKAAAGLIRPTRGDVFLGENGLPALESAARSVLSYLPQKVAFPDSLKGREIVEFHRALRNVDRSRVGEVLEMVSLNGAADQSVGTYSGGMVQRLGLAIAILAGAPLLLLDEPTAALDPEGLAVFYAQIESGKREGNTIFFTSHQMGDVERLADRFGIVVSGRLVAVFTRREFADRLADRGLLRLRVDRVRPLDESRLREIAAEASIAESEIVIRCPASSRAAAIDAVRNAGMTIESLTTEEPRLDALYRELVGEHS